MKKSNISILFLLGFIVGISAQQHYEVKRLTSNTEYSDFGVSFYQNDKVVFASSMKVRGNDKFNWRGNGQPYLDLYVAELTDENDFSGIKRFSKNINSIYHESNVAFTKDGKTVYFSRNNFTDKELERDLKGRNLIGLYKASLNDNGEWDSIERLPFNIENYQCGHPALNEKEDKLFFISDRPGSYGETDIYYVDINSDGSFGSPINMGPEINTVGKEMFPYVDMRNNLLYFSSDGFKDNYGGLDIYVVKLNDTEVVTVPKNLESPINSKSDDFSFVLKSGDNWGYFSSNRYSKFNDDIYYFKKYSDADFIDESSLVAIRTSKKCTKIIQGEVREAGTNALIPGSLVDLNIRDGIKVESVKANDLGQFFFELECNDKKRYYVTGYKKNYKRDTKELVENHKIILSLTPDEFVKTRGYWMLNMNPIYFDLDDYEIRKNAAIELEKVVKVLKNYPELTIELRSHTDSRADDDYNLKLSNKRAASSKDWLVSRGIHPNRITAKGYGETQLVNGCANNVRCTNAQHLVNRRTEFIITNPEKIK